MGGSVKDPDHEAETPAPTFPSSERCAPGGPNTQGNDHGKLEQDPEGQQGGGAGSGKN